MCQLGPGDSDGMSGWDRAAKPEPRSLQRALVGGVFVEIRSPRQQMSTVELLVDTAGSHSGPQRVAASHTLHGTAEQQGRPCGATSMQVGHKAAQLRWSVHQPPSHQSCQAGPTRRDPDRCMEIRGSWIFHFQALDNPSLSLVCASSPPPSTPAHPPARAHHHEATRRHCPTAAAIHSAGTADDVDHSSPKLRLLAVPSYPD